MDTRTSTIGFTFNRLRDHLKSDEEVRLYAQDACMLAVTEAVEAAIKKSGVSKAELATRIGRTKGFVSNVLNGSRNMTLKTVADLFWAIGLEVQGVDVAALGESTVPTSFIDQWLDDEANVQRAMSVQLGDRPMPKLEIQQYKLDLVAA